MLFGAHVSISGGVKNAPDNGAKLGCDVIQIFSKNQQQWRAKPLDEENLSGFKEGLKRHRLGPTLIHCSYLLNLASSDDALFEKSVEGLVVELERAEALGVEYVVFHPGSPKDKGAQWGVKRVGEGVTRALEATRGGRSMVLLETNAGAGAAVGRTFEELAGMMDHVGTDRSRVGVCFDTCHAFVAGYALHTEEGYDDTFATFDNEVGLDRLKCFHLNDSAAEHGSNRDRHANLGQGLMGEVPFRRLATDERFRATPGYLETPGGDEGYVSDLKILRAYAKGE